MSQYPEYLNVRAPSGTAKALEEAAKREGKRPAEIVREAIAIRLASFQHVNLNGVHRDARAA